MTKTAKKMTKTLVYDGDCSICEASALSLVRLRLIPVENCRPYQGYDEATQERLANAGIRNEMAVVDRDTDEIRIGLPAILWALKDTSIGFAARALDIAPIRTALTFCYRLFAYNRRIVVPRRPRPIPCACDPDFHLGYRFAFILLGVAFAIVFSLWVGSRFTMVSEFPRAGGSVLPLVAAAASGWVVMFLCALGLRGELRYSYLGHLTVTMNAGLMVYLPVVVLSYASQAYGIVVLYLLSAVASDLWMLCMQFRRVAALGLSRLWVAGWFLALHIGAALMLALPWWSDRS